MITPDSVAEDLRRIRGEAPLVHNITNFVVMSSTANALLAVGASPVMAHALEEVEEMVGLARALVLNIGTLSPSWVDAMVLAGRRARGRGVPVVLDPVGVGATTFRTMSARRLLEEVRPTIVRGNASEIRALAGEAQSTKGVDSTETSDAALAAARALVERGSVVTVSGEVDVVMDGQGRVRVANGHPLMTRVTGMGCAASALTAAFASVNPSAIEAAAHAMIVMGVAGEIAAGHAAGPGSFWVHWLDAVSALDEAEITARIRVS
jgi:hydroxyethylthiazole kinase